MAAALALKISLTQPTANGWRKWFVHHTDSHAFPRMKLILPFVFTRSLSKLGRWSG